jgi:hypothetical protein
MKRNILIGSVLTLMLLCAIFAGGHVEAARDCPHDVCVTMYNDCEAACNGSRPCIKACVLDYNECVCSNCGLCSGPPPAASKARTSLVTVVPGTTKDRGFGFPVTRAQALP